MALVACGGKEKPAPPVVVAGQVVDQATGKPVEKLVVTFHPQGPANAESRATVVLDGEGKFTASLAPGKYKVTLSPLPGGHGTAAGPDFSAPEKAPAENVKLKPGPKPHNYRDAASSPLALEVVADGDNSKVVFRISK